MTDDNNRGAADEREANAIAEGGSATDDSSSGRDTFGTVIYVLTLPIEV